MHELSLAHGLIEQLLGLAKEHKAERITKVTVTLGPFSGIAQDSFEFGFNHLKKTRNATCESILKLETPDPVYICLDCDKVSVIPFLVPNDLMDMKYNCLNPKKCPWCCSNRLSPKGGTELILNQVEME
jgi:hydrogenase nickel incorporation protein HypA/HybF